MKIVMEQIPPYRPLDVPPLLPYQPATPSTMPAPFVHVYKTGQWDYKCILRNLTLAGMLTEDELNTLGAEGWELTSVVNDSPLVYFYFKRPVH